MDQARKLAKKITKPTGHVHKGIYSTCGGGSKLGKVTGAWIENHGAIDKRHALYSVPGGRSRKR